MYGIKTKMTNNLLYLAATELKINRTINIRKLAMITPLSPKAAYPSVAQKLALAFV